MRLVLFVSVIFIIAAVGYGCAPLRDAAGNVSGEVGEMSDELGSEHKIGESENPIIVSPMEDKKIRMSF